MNRHVGATIVPWNVFYLQDGLLLPLNQCQLSTDSPSVQLTGEAAIHCYEKNVPTGVILDQIFKFKTLLEASSLEGYFSFEYQT